MMPKSLSLRNTFFQVIIGLVANSNVLSPGMSIGFTAIVVPQLRESHLTDVDEASWIASIPAITSPLGALAAAWLLPRLGPRFALLAYNVPCCLGWALIAFAPLQSSHYFFLGCLYAGRALAGFAQGGSATTATLYVTEVASEELRGALVSGMMMASTAGVLLAYALGYLLPGQWRLVAGISAVLPIVTGIVSLCVLPESPLWLNRVREEANTKTLQRETNPILKIFRKGNWRPFLLINVIFLCQQFAGVYVILYYAVDMVKTAGISVERYLAAVYIGCVKLVITIIVCLTAKPFGKRMPLLLSSSGMVISMAALAAHSAFNADGQLTWIPLVALGAFIISASLGVMPLPWTLVGEHFPHEIRNCCSSVCSSLAFVYMFLSVKMFPFMESGFGRSGLFLTYMCSALVCAVVVFLWLPETQGCTLEEIQEYWRRVAKKHNSLQVENGKKRKNENANENLLEKLTTNTSIQTKNEPNY